MDIDLILESIFLEYKEKSIQLGKEKDVIESHLELVREQMEQAIKDATDDFIGRPSTDETRQAMRDIINQNLNQFLDTDITLDGITQDGDSINVEITYRSRDPMSGILVQGSVTALTVNPAQDIISHSL